MSTISDAKTHPVTSNSSSNATMRPASNFPEYPQAIEIIDPYENYYDPPSRIMNISHTPSQEEATLTEDSDDFSYRRLYISRVVFYPCIMLCLLSAVFMVIIIFKFLRLIIKLYLSVVLYAISCVALMLAFLYAVFTNKVSYLQWNFFHKL